MIDFLSLQPRLHVGNYMLLSRASARGNPVQFQCIGIKRNSLNSTEKV